MAQWLRSNWGRLSTKYWKRGIPTQTENTRYSLPKSRDQIVEELHDPAVFFAHLSSKAQFGTAILAVVWARASALQTLTALLIGGVLWVFGHTFPHSTSIAWIVYALLAISTSSLAWGVVYLLKSTQLLDTVDPLPFGDIAATFDSYKSACINSPEPVSPEERTRWLRTGEAKVLFGNWIEVTETLQNSNEVRQRNIEMAHRLITGAIAPFIVGTLVAVIGGSL